MSPNYRPNVIVGPQSFIVGGMNYNSVRLDFPISLQGIKNDQKIVIKEDVLLGGQCKGVRRNQVGQGQHYRRRVGCQQVSCPNDHVKGGASKTLKMHNAAQAL